MGEAGNYRYIIDCLLNLPLLYWASEVTGEEKYKETAHKHITTCLGSFLLLPCFPMPAENRLWAEIWQAAGLPPELLPPTKFLPDARCVGRTVMEFK